MQKRSVKLQLKYDNSKTTYFKFFASEKYPGCFWGSVSGGNIAFELHRIHDWEFIDKSVTWEKLKNEKTTS